MGRRDGDARGDRLPRASFGHEPLERVEHRRSSRSREGRGSRTNLGRGGRDAAHRLTVAVQRPLLVQAQAEPLRRRREQFVAGQHELRTELEDRTVVEPT